MIRFTSSIFLIAAIVAILSSSAAARLVVVHNQNTTANATTLAAKKNITTRVVNGTLAPLSNVSSLIRPDGIKSQDGGSCYSNGQFSGYMILSLQQCQSDSAWTIHGLWPQCSQNSWPSFCGGPSFDPSELSSSTINSLNQIWPTCSWSHSSENSFLSHEWAKHGTCSGMGMNDYFATAIALYQQGSWQSQCQGTSGTCKVAYSSW